MTQRAMPMLGEQLDRSLKSYRSAQACHPTRPALELELRPIDVFETLQRIGTQREPETRPVRGVHGSVRANIERFVEQLPHHRHVALRHLEDVAVGGCHAEALSNEITVDTSELEDARWFDREEAAQMLLRRHPVKFGTPPPVAIAYHIIRAFVEEGDAVLR